MLTPIGRKHTARQPAVRLGTTVTPVVVLAEERNGYIPLRRLPPLRERARRRGRSGPLTDLLSAWPHPHCCSGRVKFATTPGIRH
jgi:hypothetical protein